MKNEKGTSLLEAILVVAVVGAIVFLIAAIPNALMLISKSNHTSLAREIAVKQIEDKRNINYVNLVNGTTDVADSRISFLPNGNGTVAVDDCDPAICTNSEHVKKITVTVNWKDNNKTQTITLNTFIGEGGLNQ